MQSASFSWWSPLPPSPPPLSLSSSSMLFGKIVRTVVGTHCQKVNNNCQSMFGHRYYPSLPFPPFVEAVNQTSSQFGFPPFIWLHSRSPSLPGTRIAGTRHTHRHTTRDSGHYPLSACLLCRVCLHFSAAVPLTVLPAPSEVIGKSKTSTAFKDKQTETNVRERESEKEREKRRE